MLKCKGQQNRHLLVKRQHAQHNRTGEGPALNSLGLSEHRVFVAPSATHAHLQERCTVTPREKVLFKSSAPQMLPWQTGKSTAWSIGIAIQGKILARCMKVHFEHSKHPKSCMKENDQGKKKRKVLWFN